MSHILKRQGMESIKKIYENIKKTGDLPYGWIWYIKLDENGYHLFNKIAVSFRNGESKKAIQEMKTLSHEHDFYAFHMSKKGLEFTKKNDAVIRESYYNTVMNLKWS
jgi:hypothetical protein